MARIEGKVCLITGAGSGLGAADAKRLAEEGAQVILTDLDAERVANVASGIPGARFFTHDVREEGQWRTIIGEVCSHFERLDVLVNNAGLVRFASVEDVTMEEWRLHLDVMITGTMLGCKYAIPVMAKGGGGSIVNMASVAALKGIGVLPAYSAAKGAIVSLTRSVAVHCQEQGYGIRVNSLLPGAHDTPMTAAAIQQLPSEEAGLAAIQALGQGKPVDVANLVLFLASDESRWINGTSMVIDNCETIR